MSAEQTPDIETLAPLVRLADEWAAEGDEMSHWFASQVLYNAIDEARQALAPVLAAAVRDAEQRAWDEGYDARGIDISNEGLMERTLTRNPYRVVDVTECP